MNHDEINQELQDPNTGAGSWLYAAQRAEGGPTADGERGRSGRETAPGGQGPAASAAAWAVGVRRRVRATYQSVERAYNALAHLAPDGNLDDAFISSEILDGLRAPWLGASAPELASAMFELREAIPLIPLQSIARLRRLRLADERAESEAFYDASSGLVYKALFKSPNLGRVGDGYVPGRLWEEGASDTAPVFLKEFTARLALNNDQGGQVLTEVAGITPSGRIVVVQPYVPGLRPGPLAWDTAAPLVRRLGLAPVCTDTAVGWAGDKPIVVGDLHNFNLMVNEDGAPFIVDGSSRLLTMEEARLPRVSAALGEARRWADKLAVGR
jgi:hypothetical protein